MKETEWLQPREIAKRGLIKSPGRANTIDGHYRYIMRLINAGKLQAENWSTSDYRAYWVVSTDEIAKYNEKKGQS